MTIDPRIQQALRIVAADDPDRASTHNAVGYSKSDGGIGHVLATTPVERWSPKMAKIAYKLALKYRRQVLAAGLDVSDIVEPVVEDGPRVATISAYRSGLAFRSHKDDPAVQLVREMSQRRWLGAPDFCWAIPLVAANLPALRTMYRAGVAFSPEALAKLRQVAS